LPEFDLLDVGRRLHLPLRQQATLLIRLDGDNGDATLDQWRSDFQKRAHQSLASVVAGKFLVVFWSFMLLPQKLVSGVIPPCLVKPTGAGSMKPAPLNLLAKTLTNKESRSQRILGADKALPS
jgi:hypothetical protein